MAPSDIALFGVTLFLALCALLMWKRRRDFVQARMNDKLRVYMAIQEDQPAEEDEAGDPMARVA